VSKSEPAISKANKKNLVAGIRHADEECKQNIELFRVQGICIMHLHQPNSDISTIVSADSV